MSADLECPKCHTVFQQHTTHKEVTRPVVEHSHYKSPGTAGILAFIGGIFSLLGIGHIYVGKVRRGIIMMICGLVLVVILAIFVGILSGLSTAPSSSTDILPPSTDIPSPSTSDLAEDSIFQGGMIYVTIFTLALAVGYFVLFIWQIIDARKYARLFNEAARNTGKEPW